MSADPLPVVVFAFNRPEKLRRVLGALRSQGVDRLEVFVDGPRNAADLRPVEACRNLARSVDWAETQLHLREENHGLPGLADNVSLALESHPWAVFVEDDCLPTPDFYTFMRQALQRYRDVQRVFSIGGYQPVKPHYFRDDPYAVVSSARFTCWGWATWRDRWQEVLPYLERYAELFDGLQHVSEIAGIDMPWMAQSMALGSSVESWDVKVALACLWLKKVHLLATRGLVRNIGQDRSGIHGGLRAAWRGWRLHNRNLAAHLPENLLWPETIDLDCRYADELRSFVVSAHSNSLRRLWQRGQVLARRYLLPGKERLFDLNLIGAAPDSLGKQALLSYIVHPFAIPRHDPRFLRHINIWHAQEIVRTLNRMGYRVDVIDYRDTSFIPRKPYDLFIGHGGVNFEQVARQLPESARAIYFSTGAYWQFHNQQEASRFEDLRRRRNITLPLDRTIAHSEEGALRLADGVIGIGNDFTRRTYREAGNDSLPVRMINGASLYDDRFEWCEKDYDSGRKNYLFFAGGGSVHKGLDLLLEAFDGLEQHLWVATRVEPPFRRAYASETSLPNIHMLGWVQPRSALFYQVMRTCNFCILPSCSEGQSQSVVECMNQGLIPVVSWESGIDISDESDRGDFGVLIAERGTELSPALIRSLVDRLSGWPVEHCRAMSLRARTAAQRDFSEEHFAQSFQQALTSLLEGPR